MTAGMLHSRTARPGLLVFISLVLLGLVVLKIDYFNKKVIAFWLPTNATSHLTLTKTVHTPAIHWDKLDCDELFAGNLTVMRSAKSYQFNYTQAILRKIKRANDSCAAFQEIFNFHQTPLSQEEADFPLAFGMLVYTNVVQILLQIKSLYQPQNVFVIAVSDVPDRDVYNILKKLEDCLPNLKVFQVPTVSWCGPSILTASFEVLQRLSRMTHPWKYYQFLSGVDVPLKTNLEMVRIFKTMGGAFDQYIVPFEKYRYSKRKPEDSPISPLYKNMIALVLPRQIADWVVRSEICWKMVVYLNETYCADESFWGTVLFNGPQLGLPGGVDGEKWMKRWAEVSRLFQEKGKLRHVWSVKTPIPDPPGVYSVIPLDEYSFMGGYITRFQLWADDKRLKCSGRWQSGSCVFGIADLPMLRRQMQLVVHKMYLSVQPAAPICLWREIERRTNERSHFDPSPYKALPLVRHHNGESIETMLFTQPV